MQRRIKRASCSSEPNKKAQYQSHRLASFQQDKNRLFNQPIFTSSQHRSEKSVQNPRLPKLEIDFSFNTIKDVKKVRWKHEAPWYREISDGFSWLCYCNNENCYAYKELVVINRGYIYLTITEELRKLVCPCCKKGNKRNHHNSEYSLIIRNCGFVNCVWAMKGVMINNLGSKIYSEGKTYDSKLYTFKEIDYRKQWHQLEVCVKHLTKNTQQNIPTDAPISSSKEIYTDSKDTSHSRSKVMNTSDIELDFNGVKGFHEQSKQ